MITMVKRRMMKKKSKMRGRKGEVAGDWRKHPGFLFLKLNITFPKGMFIIII